MKQLPIEKKELWGLTLPSILACGGTILAVAGARFWLSRTWGVALAIIGLCLIALALRSNWLKGFTVRWRKTNFVLHIVLFVLSAVFIGLIAFKRHHF
jgi:hypothetical protein